MRNFPKRQEKIIKLAKMRVLAVKWLNPLTNSTPIKSNVLTSLSSKSCKNIGKVLICPSSAPLWSKESEFHRLLLAVAKLPAMKLEFAQNSTLLAQITSIIRAVARSEVCLNLSYTVDIGQATKMLDPDHKQGFVKWRGMTRKR